MKNSEIQIELRSDADQLEAPISLTPDQLELAAADLDIVSGGSVSTILGGIFWWLRS